MQVTRCEGPLPVISRVDFDVEDYHTHSLPLKYKVRTARNVFGHTVENTLLVGNFSSLIGPYNFLHPKKCQDTTGEA